MSDIDANSLIETTVNLILDHPRKYYDFMQFTKPFDQHFKTVSRRLGTEEGLSSMVLNYLGLNKIDEDLLHDMCIMIWAAI